MGFIWLIFLQLGKFKSMVLEFVGSLGSMSSWKGKWMHTREQKGPLLRQCTCRITVPFPWQPLILLPLRPFQHFVTGDKFSNTWISGQHIQTIALHFLKVICHCCCQVGSEQHSSNCWSMESSTPRWGPLFLTRPSSESGKTLDSVDSNFWPWNGEEL